MGLSDDMRQLSQNLLKDYDDRMNAVVGIRRGAAQTLAELGKSRQVRSAEQQQFLNEQTDELRRNTADFLKEMDTSHQVMATEQRQRLGQHASQLHHETASFLNELDAAQQDVTAEQKQQLAEYMDELRRSISEMRSAAADFVQELDDAHQVMATEQRQQLSEQADDLRRYTADFLKALDDAHRAMSVQQSRWLAASRSGLASDVAAMRDEARAEQSSLRADLSDARQAWGDLDKLIQQRKTMKMEPARPAPAPQVEKKVSVPQSPPAAAVLPAAEVLPAKALPASETPDDLTVIRGIGSRVQQILNNEAGIYTISQLAGSTPEDVRLALGGTARLANVEDWIAQAQGLEQA